MSLFGDLPAPARAKDEVRGRDNSEDQLKAQLEALKQGHFEHDSEEEEEEEEEEDEELDVDEEEAHAATLGSDLRRRTRPREEEEEEEKREEGEREAVHHPHARGQEAAVDEGPSRPSNEAKRVRIHEDVVTATYERPLPTQQTRPGGEEQEDEVSIALRRIASHIGNASKFSKVRGCCD